MITDDRIFYTSSLAGRIDPPRMVQTVAPAVEPVSVDELREYARRDDQLELTTITTILKAARAYFEKMTGLALIAQSWRCEFDGWRNSSGALGLTNAYGSFGVGRVIDLPRTPLLTLDLVQYKAETTGTLTTFAASNYTAQGIGIPGAFPRLWLNDNVSWPTIGSFPGALQFTFTAGFGASAATVPHEIRMAVLMLAAHWYENRLPLSGDGLANIPNHLESLIEMHRVAFIA